MANELVKRVIVLVLTDLFVQVKTVRFDIYQDWCQF